MGAQSSQPILLTIVVSLEQSTLASSWTEHLCLFHLSDDRLMLDVRGYEVVCDANEYWNEETEEHDLPDKIGDYDVIGIEDGWILVSNLVPTGNYSSNYIFRDFNWSDYKEVFFAEGPEFCTDEIREKIEDALKETCA